MYNYIFVIKFGVNKRNLQTNIKKTFQIKKIFHTKPPKFTDKKILEIVENSLQNFRKMKNIS